VGKNYLHKISDSAAMAGCDAVLNKPVNLNDLLGTLDKFLRDIDHHWKCTRLWVSAISQHSEFFGFTF